MKAFGNIAKDSKVRAVASGAISSGKPVVVNSDGTVSVVGIGSASIGSATKWVAAEVTYPSIAYDSNSDRVVIAYRNSSSGDNGFAVVGTVSGTSISFGTPVSFNSGSSSTNFTSTVFDSNSNKVVISYQDGGNSSYGTAIVGTVDPSDNSISFGTEVVFNSGNSDNISSTFDSSANKVIIAYRDQGNSSHGTAIVGTVSGTSISFGSEAVFNAAQSTDIATSYDSSSNKTIIAYTDYGNSYYGTAIVGTVSGTSISFGSESVFETGTTQYTKAVYDSGNNKTNIFYMDGSDSDKGKAVIGTVSGTSISFTTPEVFYDAAINALSVVYDSNAASSVIGIQGNSAYGYAIPITSDGSSFTVGSSTIITTNSYGTLAVSVFDPDQKKVVFAYQDADDSSHGKAQVYNTPATTLTAENYIGMSGGVAFQTGDAASSGSDSVFESASSNQIASTFDSSNNKVVIAYRDSGNSNYGTAVVGTVSGSAISFGTPVVFESANTDYIATTFDSSNNKVVIAFRDVTHSARGKAIVGTVSGTSISFGSEADFSTANEIEYVSATFDSNSNKVVISWSDKGNNSNAGTSIVGTVSGTDISFGSAVVFEAPITKDISSTFDSNSNKVVIAYRDQGNSSHGTAIVGTVSGTDISFGSAVVFEASEISTFTSTTFDSSNNKVVITTRHPTTDAGQAYVGTVSGTSISFGSVVEFTDGSSNDTRLASAVFDTNLNKVVIAYVNANTEVSAISGTVSGTSISFGSQSTVKTGNNLDNLSAVFDSNSNKVVISYRDVNNSNHGTSNVFTPSTIATTRGEVADGGKAVIDSTNAISRNQIGLTAGQTLYVQTDGTLSETAGSPSVTAGTAISATEIIVKG